MTDRIESRSAESLLVPTVMNRAVEEAYSGSAYQSVFAPKSAGSTAHESKLDFASADIYAEADLWNRRGFGGHFVDRGCGDSFGYREGQNVGQRPVEDPEGVNGPARRGTGPRVPGDIYHQPPPPGENNSNLPANEPKVPDAPLPETPRSCDLSGDDDLEARGGPASSEYGDDVQVASFDLEQTHGSVGNYNIGIDIPDFESV